MVRDINDHGLEQRVLESEGIVAVAFLDFCSIPCDHFRPELTAVSESMDGKMEFRLRSIMKKQHRRSLF